MTSSGAKNKIIFFGNGPLSEYALRVLEQRCEVIFHVHVKEEIEEAIRLKQQNPDAIGVLASFGVLISSSVLEVFEPEGILNIHPSLLPLYRGASPIESAILDGASEFGVSVMKLAKAMDAGPVYYQTKMPDLPLSKDAIYQALATKGAEWICVNLDNLPEPVAQDESKATYCGKLDKSMSYLTPETDTAEQTLRKIVAFQGYPKPKYTFFGKNCIILEAHILEGGETALIPLPCANGATLSIDLLQPEGKKPMDAKSFLNGYGK